jgi:hypothetical protein
MRGLVSSASQYAVRELDFADDNFAEIHESATSDRTWP